MKTCYLQAELSELLVDQQSAMTAQSLDEEVVKAVRGFWLGWTWVTFCGLHHVRYRTDINA